ncbi:RNA-binding protein 5 isoform X2 [Eurytemora carolleeae]|uniref:RNA-binding protein 5 isoform X2 n=1 Tax=Eurytemora carolleeae TaxID=1294199 RepID=UPI000C770812|nr:RNA-binding protein 5 isoform X2 [Eurytemora carolleeae]|eukprot:XP_023327115.1 RNA-binding protein 5-like isoform X2 [Eurytemora affinis]
MKHNTVSDLHKQNLETWKQAKMERRLSAPVGLQYRDRAKERRNKFGDDDIPPPNKFKEKYMKAMDNIAASTAADTTDMKIGDDNVGNKMLQKMGWKEGLGLGKANQGRTDIVDTSDGRTNSAGLGVKQVARRTKYTCF